MRFKVDENLPVELAERLREEGHEAHTIEDEELQGAPDPVVVGRCRGESRALVTLDQDFGNIRAYPPAEHAGLIVLDLRSQAKPHVLAVFDGLMPLFEIEPLAGRLWVVQEDRVRIRE